MMQIMGLDADEKDIGFAMPYGMTIEGPVDGIQIGLGATEIDCGNPKCDTGCHDVALLIVSAGVMVSYRYETDIIRKPGESILAACDIQDAKRAKRNGQVN